MSKKSFFNGPRRNSSFGMNALTDAGNGPPAALCGVTQNLHPQIQAFGGGSNWSACYRSSSYSNAPFTSIRAVIGWFYQTDSPLADTDFANSYTAQVGLEYPYVDAFTGIPARVPFTWGGENTITYVADVGPLGFSVSDPLPFNYTPGSLSTPNRWGHWTTIENKAGSGSGSNTIPAQTSSTNFFQRYSGITRAASSYIAARYALDSSSIPNLGSTQSGANNGFGPLAFIIETPANYVHILGFGASLNVGIGEGGPGSGSSGDSQGSPLGNDGYLSRWIFEKLGHNYVNLGRASDRFSFYSSANWKYRLLLATLLNPTHLVSENGINDLTAGSNLATILANAQATYAGLNAACPGVPIIQCCATCATTSTDSWATVANQTVRTGMGNSSSVRGQWNNAYIRANGSPLGNAGFIDANPALESGYAEGNPGSETSKWNIVGSGSTPNGYTQGDGVHPNSYGYERAATLLVASRGGVIVTDPFL